MKSKEEIMVDVMDVFSKIVKLEKSHQDSQRA